GPQIRSAVMPVSVPGIFYVRMDTGDAVPADQHRLFWRRCHNVWTLAPALRHLRYSYAAAVQTYSQEACVCIFTQLSPLRAAGVCVKYCVGTGHGKRTAGLQ